MNHPELKHWRRWILILLSIIALILLIICIVVTANFLNNTRNWQLLQQVAPSSGGV